MFRYMFGDFSYFYAELSLGGKIVFKTCVREIFLHRFTCF